jgi:uncharacterized protein (TIGR03437 family)
MFSKVVSLCFAVAATSFNLAPMAFASGPQEIQGPITVMVADYFKEHRAETKYYIKNLSDSQDYEVNLSSEPLVGLTTGMIVKSSGYLHGKSMMKADVKVISPRRRSGGSSTMSSGSGGATSIASINDTSGFPELTPVSGVQKTLVIMLESATSKNNFTNSRMQEVMFANSGLSINTFYKQNSFGKVSVEGDIVGPYVINVPSMCDMVDTQTQALKAVANDTQSHININDYAHKIFMIPVELKDLCKWGGLSSIGGLPSTSIINSGAFDTWSTNIFADISHEVGHAFGMAHAQSIESDGSVVEYGDNSCIMGDKAYKIVGMHVPHLIQQGWIPLSSVQSVSRDNVYYISNSSSENSTPRALQIKLPGSSDTLYISYRQANGLDEGLIQGFTSGVSVHMWNGGSQRTQLLTTFAGGALSDNQTFTRGNLTIKQISHDSALATVQVSFTPLAITQTTAVTVNAASNLPAIAPGSLATIYGLNVPQAVVAKGKIPYGQSLGGFEVTLNGIASDLLFVSSGQINFRVPDAVSTSAPGDLVVKFYGQVVAEQKDVVINDRAVGMFVVANPNTTQPAYLNALVTYYKDGVASPIFHTVIQDPNDSSKIILNPISLDPSKGQAILSIYATGLNGLNVLPKVSFNNDQNGTLTSYSGPQPTYPGLDQINVEIPPGLKGLVTVSIPGFSQSLLMQIAN